MPNIGRALRRVARARGVRLDIVEKDYFWVICWGSAALGGTVSWAEGACRRPLL